jgi:GNAT superfamily N-acetyltransferase
VEVRPAGADELPDARNVFDGGLLQVDHDVLADAVNDGRVLVAVTASGTVLGALVLDGEEIPAVAVRRRRRDQGIGTALVDAARDRPGRLVAEFDERVRPFWESLGFAVENAGVEGRYRGTLAD